MSTRREETVLAVTAAAAVLDLLVAGLLVFAFGLG
jgi:hypothetical protein